LFFWGVLDYAVRKSGLSFELWDVLTQLSFTTLVAFLILDGSVPAQLAVSGLCLLVPELLYRYTHIPGFDQPFTDQHNFGNYMDLILMNKINHDGWVAINCISTSAHTIWGVLAGKLLLSHQSSAQKLKYLMVSGLVLLILGFGLDLSGITPIIKRIATSSFVLASGGYCILFLSVCYWWVDIKNHKNHLQLFTLFALNSIFIYLFNEIVEIAGLPVIYWKSPMVYSALFIFRRLPQLFWVRLSFLPWRRDCFIFFTGGKYFSSFDFNSLLCRFQALLVQPVPANDR
jgi:predicted acyltransferase